MSDVSPAGGQALSLRNLLERYRAGSSSEREQGTYFERLVKVWLEIAPTQKTQFSRVLMFADWAKETPSSKAVPPRTTQGRLLGR